MRNNLVVGILRETKGFEHRAPLVPADVKWLVNREIKIEVESSLGRVFSDGEYKKNGALITDKIREASLLVGIKEPRIHDLHSGKTYMVFSHTAKGQKHNMPLLKACLKRKISLVDYERIVDLHGARLVYFGRFAGICGIVDTLHYLGRKLDWKGIKNHFSLIRPAYEYESLDVIKDALEEVNGHLKKDGLPQEISPFIIGISGHGNVSRGVQEILELFRPLEIHPRNMLDFVQHQKRQSRKVHKIVFLREEKLRSKEGRGFYFEDYLKNPDNFESNMDRYLPYINVLLHTAYWDKKFPRLVTKKMLGSLSKKKPFRLEFIGDLSCDVKGSMEITHKTTTRAKPTFTYNPAEKKFTDGYKSEGVTVLAVDNLPAELPKDASDDFSRLIRDYVYQIAVHGISDITNHMAIPAEIRNAVVTQGGKLTGNFSYLKKHIS